MLTIEVVSDVVCPWCYIGTRRLDAALALVRGELPGLGVSVRWRPFFLSPDIAPGGQPYLPFMVAKFGSIEKVQEIFRRVEAAGAAYGLDYRFDQIRLRINTLDAHRLIHWRQSAGEVRPLVERLFVGQFQRGENLGDRRLLADIAAEVGADRQAAAAYLDSDAGTAEVLRLEAESRSWGVSVVPTFVVDHRIVIAGAEDPRILADAILRATRPQ